MFFKIPLLYYTVLYSIINQVNLSVPLIFWFTIFTFIYGWEALIVSGVVEASDTEAWKLYVALGSTSLNVSAAERSYVPDYLVLVNVPGGL